ncbi:MAG: nucleotidyl transferase AbiEii/AbiGii toxin family protein, partial [Candidatus Poribacteria bacterium]
KTIAMDSTNLLEKLIDVLEKHQIKYCIIGGQAINAYVEPLVSLDLDIVIATEQINKAISVLSENFDIKTFEHSLNISLPNSDLRVQIQLDPRYASFPEHSEKRKILGLTLPVASLDDLLQGKIWAIQDVNRRASKRQKDLADISRLLETYPHLREKVPEDILSRLL